MAGRLPCRGKNTRNTGWVAERSSTGVGALEVCTLIRGALQYALLYASGSARSHG